MPSSVGVPVKRGRIQTSDFSEQSRKVSELTPRVDDVGEGVLPLVKALLGGTLPPYMRTSAVAELRTIKNDLLLAAFLKMIQDGSLLKLLEGNATVSPEETIKKLIAELIPTLPPAAEEKAEAIIALNRTLNQTFWQELRGEAEPLIKSLLENIPADYEGKRRRATLINALLTALELGIQIQDQHGQSHVCSVQASQARETDHTGNLRLRRRTASDGSQRTFPLPLLDEIRIIETPRQDRAEHEQSHRSTLAF